MNNLHLFELINATPGLSLVQQGCAIALAEWVIYLAPLSMAIAWVRGDHVARRDLLQMLLAVLIALALAQVVCHLWPQPRPFTQHLGTQYLEHDNYPGLPSDHVTFLWSLALAAFTARRFAVWGFPLLAMGLVVGWSRVYLGVHFPFDILAAFPVACAGAFAAKGLRRPMRPVIDKTLDLYDRLANLLCGMLGAARKA